MEPDDARGVQARVRRLNGTTIALLAGLAALVLVVLLFATRGNSDQDKLINAQVTASGASSREKLCASQATYNLIKQDLFRRAAQVRGSDRAAYDQISGSAALRMENPVMESEDSRTGAVHCSGSLSLDLPPGVAVVGGRRTLAADVDYIVQQAADGSGPVILLSNAEPIVTPLATLARVAEPRTEVESPTDAISGAADTAAGNGVEPSPQPPMGKSPRPPPLPQPSPQGPSFSCASARTPGEASVCGDPRLAALDRAMAAEYARAVGFASTDQRDLLRQTAHSFYAYRDRCPDRQCIAAAYAGRIREIRDIVEGRWQPPR